MSLAAVPGLPVSIQIAKESTYGVKPTIGSFPARVESLSEVIGNEKIQSTLLASQNVQEKVYYGIERGGYTFEGELHSGEPLSWIFGTDVVTGTGPYTHTKSYANLLPSLSAEIWNVGLPFSRDYLGGVVNELRLSGVTNEALKIGGDVISRGPVKNASPTAVSEITTDPFLFKQCTLTINGTAYEDVVPGFEFKVNRGLKPITGMGSEQITNIVPGRRLPELTMDLYPQDSTFFDLVKNQTEFVTTLLFTRGVDDTIQINIPSTKILQYDPSLGEDAYEVNIPFEIGGDITVVSINSESAAWV